MLTALILIIAALCTLCLLPIALALMLRALPLFIGLVLCWWCFQGCL